MCNCTSENPYSRSWLWIPGLRQVAHPRCAIAHRGMTSVVCWCDPSENAARRANHQNLSSPFRKNISLNPSGKSSLELRPILSRERALAIVTNVGAGCGGRGSVGRATGSQGGSIRERSTARRRTALKRTAKPCGPGTRCWCQVGGGFAGPTGLCKTVNSPTTVTRRIRRRARHKP
jgi:hypothetical protein